MSHATDMAFLSGFLYGFVFGAAAVVVLLFVIWMIWR